MCALLRGIATHHPDQGRGVALSFGVVFSTVEQLKSDGLLGTRILLIDWTWCAMSSPACFAPVLTATKQNDHVAKARVFLDSADVLGSCAELSANVSRSQVDPLSFNSGLHEGWQTDSIPSTVFDEGSWKYVRSRHSRCMVACGKSRNTCQSTHSTLTFCMRINIIAQPTPRVNAAEVV